MKRDMELVRKILEFAVEHYIPFRDVEVIIDGYDEKIICLYLTMLHEAGYIVMLPVAQNHMRPGNYRNAVFHITWKGYELLESLS
jgi:hypothetical protein